MLRDEMELQKAEGNAVDDDYFSSRVVQIEQEAARQEKDALATYGMLEGTDPHIAPLRRALAVYGLTADDIGVLSIHGTSTQANEANERERGMKLSHAFRVYPKAIAWSMILSSCLIMEGFGTAIVGSCKSHASKGYECSYFIMLIRR